MRSILIFILTCLSVTILAQPQSVKKIDIGGDRDSRYLPYRMEPLASVNQGTTSRQMIHPILVHTPYRDEGDSILLVRCYNPLMNTDMPAIINYTNYTRGATIDDTPIWVYLSDMALYHDSYIDNQAVAACGFWNDTAYVIKHFLEKDSTVKIYLTHGRDRTGNGSWEPYINVLLTEDYDFDGNTEAFFYVNSGRDMYPRELFCVEMESMEIEWSLSVASLLNPKFFLSLRDAENPGVIFTAYNPKQGAEDKNFSDRFNYLVIVDRNGHIRRSNIMSETYGTVGLVRAADDSTFYVYYSVPFAEPDETENLPADDFGIARIDRNGEIICQTSVPEEIKDAWIMSASDHAGQLLHTLNTHGVLRVYDDGLNLVAESNESNMRSYLGSIKLPGRKDDSHIFGCVHGDVDLYDDNYDLIAKSPTGFSYMETLEYDQYGAIRKFVFASVNRYEIARFAHRDFYDYAKIFFWDYQEYFLVVLSLVLLGLVVSNISRQKYSNELQRTERRYRAIVEASPDAVFHLHRDGTIIDTSFDRREGLLMPERSVIGHNVNEFLPPDLSNMLRERTAETLDKGRVSYVEYSHNEGNKHYDHTAQIVKCADDEVYVFVRDITETRRETFARKEIEHMLFTLYDTANSLILCLNASGRITVFNRECERRTGYTRQEALGQDLKSLLISEDDRAQIHGHFSEWLKSLPSDNFEMPLKTKSGNILTILWSASSYISERTNELTAIVVGQDITERNRDRKRLAASEKRYRNLLETVRYGITECDLTGKIIFANAAYGKLMGEPPETWIGTYIWEPLAHKEKRDAFLDYFRHLVEEQPSPETYFGTNRAADGREFEVQVDWNYVHDESGKLTGFIAVISDISERIRAQRQLAESEARLRTLLETVPDLILMLTPEGNINYINRATNEFELDEIIGASAFDFIVPEDKHILEYAIDKCVRSRESVTYEIRARDANRGSVRYSSHMSPIMIDGKVGALNVVATDLSEIIEKREALQLSEERYRNLLANLPLGIYRSTPTEGCVSANPAMVSMYGFASEQDLKDARADFCYIEPKKRNEFLKELKEKGSVHDYEFEVRRKDGTTFWVSSNVQAKLDSKGEIEYFDGIDRDITDRKKVMIDLSRRLKFDEGLAACSKSLLLTKTGFKAAISDALSALRHAAEVDHIYFCRRPEAQGGRCRLIHYDGVDEYPETEEALPGVNGVQGFASWYEALSGGETIIYDRRSNTAEEIELMQARGVKSLYIVPIFVASKWYGSLCFDSRATELRWSYDDIRTLKTAAEMIGAYMENKEAEQEISKFKTVSDRASFGTAIVDLSGEILYVNEYFAQVHGYKPEELYGKKLAIFHNEDQIAEVQEINEWLLKRGHYDAIEVWHTHRDGTTFPMLMTGTLIRDDEGEPVMMATTAADISALKQRELELRASEEKFRSLAETTTAAIFIYQGENMVYVNSTAEQVSGYSRQEMMKIPFWGMVHPDYQDHVKSRGKDRQEGMAVPERYEVKLLTKSGKVKWADFSATVIDYEGKPAVLGTAFDITERKWAEGQLQVLMQEKYDQAKHIAGGFAHEIRNALFPARGALSRITKLDLNDQLDDEGVAHYSHIADRSIGQAIDITNLISQYTRLETELAPEKVDLRGIIARITETNQIRIRDQKVDFRTAGLDRGTILVRSNNKQAYAALNNLLLNSLDALTNTTNPVIFVEVDRSDKYVTLKFTDNGAGISEKDLPRIFDTFFSTKPDSGTGIGLAMVKKIIEMYGGEISVRSTPGDKTTFSLLFLAEQRI